MVLFCSLILIITYMWLVHCSMSHSPDQTSPIAWIKLVNSRIILSILIGPQLGGFFDIWVTLSYLAFHLCPILPDISYSVNKTCQFMNNPINTNWSAVWSILWYLSGIISFGLSLMPYITGHKSSLRFL